MFLLESQEEFSERFQNLDMALFSLPNKLEAMLVTNLIVLKRLYVRNYAEKSRPQNRSNRQHENKKQRQGWKLAGSRLELKLSLDRSYELLSYFLLYRLLG